MNADEIYPKILEESEVNKHIDQTLSKARITEMNNKKKELEKLLDHYKKIERRWTKADSVIKISGIVLTSTTAILASVFTAGAFIPVTVATTIGSVLAGFSALNIGLTETVSISYTSRKKKIYREKVYLINNYISKVYVYLEKAKEDSIITITELESFRDILIELENKLRGITFDYNKVFSEQLKKEIQQELKKNLK